MTIRADVIRGHTDAVILAQLLRRDSYGYEIARSVEQGSGGQLRIPEGAMYPTLYRMMERGYITEDQRAVGGRRLRVYYQITPAGRVRLKGLMDAYAEINAGYESCLAAMREPLPTQAEHS